LGIFGSPGSFAIAFLVKRVYVVHYRFLNTRAKSTQERRQAVGDDPKASCEQIPGTAALVER
jgi:hypothetical protein